MCDTSLSFFWALSRLSRKTRKRAAAVISMPWPRSPNITANRKGKVMMVYGAKDKPEHRHQCMRDSQKGSNANTSFQYEMQKGSKVPGLISL